MFRPISPLNMGSFLVASSVLGCFTRGSSFSVLSKSINNLFLILPGLLASLHLGFSSKLFSSDEEPFCGVSPSGQSVEIVMTTSIFSTVFIP